MSTKNIVIIVLALLGVGSLLTFFGNKIANS